MEREQVLHSRSMLVRIERCGRRAAIAMNNNMRRLSQERRPWHGECGAFQRKNCTFSVKWQVKMGWNWGVGLLAGPLRWLNERRGPLGLIFPRDNCSMPAAS